MSKIVALISWPGGWLFPAFCQESDMQLADQRRELEPQKSV